MKKLLIHYFSKVCFLIDTYVNLFDIVDPDLLILLNENIMIERTASLFSNKINLKSFLIQHGIFMGYSYRNFSTDYSLVWGENSKEFLIQRGYHNDKVFKVGYPSLSTGVVDEHSKENNNFNKVLFLGQNADNFYLMEDDYHVLLNILEKAIRCLPEIDFIIRPHPSQEKNYYNKLIKKKNINLVVENSTTLNQSFMEAKVIVTVFSTAAVEAMRHGIPIITLDTDVNNSFSPFLNFSKKAYDLKSLIKNLELLYYDKEEKYWYKKK